MTMVIEAQGVEAPSFGWFCLFCFWNRVSLYSLGWPRTHYVDQVDLELTKFCLPIFASPVQGLKICTTTPNSNQFLTMFCPPIGIWVLKLSEYLSLPLYTFSSLFESILVTYRHSSSWWESTVQEWDGVKFPAMANFIQGTGKLIFWGLAKVIQAKFRRSSHEIKVTWVWARPYEFGQGHVSLGKVTWVIWMQGHNSSSHI